MRQSKTMLKIIDPQIEIREDLLRQGADISDAYSNGNGNTGSKEKGQFFIPAVERNAMIRQDRKTVR